MKRSHYLILGEVSGEISRLPYNIYNTSTSYKLSFLSRELSLLLDDRKATSAGSLKLAQNMTLLGATSLTRCILSSSSSIFIVYSNCSDISAQIFFSSALLSSLFELKQCTWIMGSFVSVEGVKSRSFFRYKPLKAGKKEIALAGRFITK